MKETARPLEGLKAVITAGGIGTRLLPFSKEIPKEMSPIFARNPGSTPLVVPIVQAIYEQLYASGVRDFFMVVGRGKRAIQDHFSPDYGFIELLRKKGKNVDYLLTFYEKLNSSNLVFIMQPEPLGFGDAVLKARPYVNGTFVLHAGDTYIISRGNQHLKRLWDAHRKYAADASMLLNYVRDPRQYGVVAGGELEKGIVDIKEAVEKPERPKSRLAIMPVYLLNGKIFDHLSNLGPGVGGETQLTDAIRSLLSSKGRVLGVRLTPQEVMLDIGTPSTLMDALKVSGRILEAGS
jgi:UTP--glucose-1-phosphate uridylyltransferase